jgi:hypothetical protein
VPPDPTPSLKAEGRRGEKLPGPPKRRVAFRTRFFLGETKRLESPFTGSLPLRPSSRELPITVPNIL